MDHVRKSTDPKTGKVGYHKGKIGTGGGHSVASGREVVRMEIAAPTKDQPYEQATVYFADGTKQKFRPTRRKARRKGLFPKGKSRTSSTSRSSREIAEGSASVGKQGQTESDPVALWIAATWCHLEIQLKQLAARFPPLVDEDPKASAERMLSALPSLSDALIDRRLGPFYSETALQEWLGLDSRLLDELARNDSLVRAPLADGSWIYPAWQFNADGTVIGGVNDLLEVLNRAAPNDHWSVILWLRAPGNDLEGADPIRWLREGRSLTRLVGLARADTAGWTQ